MADRQEGSTLFKKEIKLPASIGDWTAYKPPKSPSRKIKAISTNTRRVSKESLDKILEVHHFFAIEFAHYLKESLKASTDIFNVTLEQMTYVDFLKRVNGGLINNKITFGGVGDAMFLVDYLLANIAINFSLGFQTTETKVKELTELEESIINSIFGSVLGSYAKCWDNVFATPAFEIISYPNIQRETHINLNEVITVITTNLSVANSVPSSYTLVFQNNTLKKLLSLLSAKQEKAPLNLSKLPDILLNAIKVPVIANIGATSITTQEIMSLEVEDVLALDQTLNEPIKIVIGYTAESKAQPGEKNGRYAVRPVSGSVKKVQSAALIMDDRTVDEPSLTSAEDIPRTESGSSTKDDDFELPLEETEKEEYNEPLENMFEEENNPGAGGK